MTAQKRSITAHLRSSLQGLAALLRRRVEEEEANLPSADSGTGPALGLTPPLSPELFAVLTHEDVIEKHNRG